MTVLFANPYDLSARGFYFETRDEYVEKANALRNGYGDPVEEFEIEFIDGEQIDAEMAKVWQINQMNFPKFFEACEDWEDEQKIRYILSVGDGVARFDPETDSPDDLDVDVYYCDSLKELAEEFVEEGLFGEIPERLRFYLDYEAIARDLACDYTEAEVDGQRLVYRCV